MSHFTPELLEQRGYVQTKCGRWEKKAVATEGAAVAAVPGHKQSGAAVVVEARGKGSPRARRAPAGKLEQCDADAPGAEAPGSEAGAARFVVRVIGYRHRLLDDDNVCEKHVVDSLRYAGLLPDDTHAQTRIVPWQVQCRKGEERTEITLIRRK